MLAAARGIQFPDQGSNLEPLHWSVKSHGQRRLAVYSPWCHRESDTTEQLSTHTYYNHLACLRDAVTFSQKRLSLAFVRRSL